MALVLDEPVPAVALFGVVELVLLGEVVLIVLVLYGLAGRPPAGLVDDAGDDGLVEDGIVELGIVELGIVDPGIVDPGIVDPGIVEPGMVEPGVAEPGVDDAPGAVPLLPPEDGVGETWAKASEGAARIAR